MLDRITPVMLVHNEEQNISRTLSHLSWAKEVIVVDSGSTDRTFECLARFSNVRKFSRSFDTHARQWSYAVGETNITTDWILRLDADYQVTESLIKEISGLDPDAPINAYRISFDYAIFSHKLVSSLYPANTVLLRKGYFSVRDRGHTEVWDVVGPIQSLTARILHDDWKPTPQWLTGQARYMTRELEWLSRPSVGVVRWLRLRPPVMPIVVFLYCLFGRGLILSGRAGLFYSLQRMIAEAILSLMILETKLRKRAQSLDHYHDHLGN